MVCYLNKIDQKKTIKNNTIVGSDWVKSYQQKNI